MSEEIRHPQVLLLGNGINVWKKGLSWSELLSVLCENDRIIDYLKNNWNKKMPMSMQALLATDDNVIGAIGRYVKKEEGSGKTNPFYGKLVNEEQMKTLQRILSIPFDAILTTNYSYELELASLNTYEVSSQRPIVKLSRTLKNRVDPRYLLSSYNQVTCNGVTNKVFHIHGEARKTSSIILGSDKYARLLSRIIMEADNRGNHYKSNQDKGLPQTYDSWIDYFLLGDVYILGFGYDFAESDLWWLLQRKKNEKAVKGNVYYFDLWTDGFNEKVELLKLMNVKDENFGIYLEEGYTNIAKMRNDERFDELYQKAITEIESNVTAAR